jgi:SAM-dependent methyltransferase
MGKFAGVVGAFPQIWQGKVLDVGCRSGNLAKVLTEMNSNVHYVGLDLRPPANVVGNLEAGLPFQDKAFDVVVALDVLEHTDDIYKAFSELCRCARRFVVITLPNIYELRGRLKFLIGKRLSGKYGLPPEPPADRHRWIFSLNEAQTFVNFRAQCCGFKVAQEGCLIGPRRALIVRALVSYLSELFCPTYLALLERV